MKRNMSRAAVGRIVVCTVAIATLLGLSAITPVRHAEAATFTVNSTNDVDDTVCDATHCSLREAINAANTSGGADTIRFIIGSGPKTIAITSALPTMTEFTVLDGGTQPGFVSVPIIEIDGSGAGAGVNGLTSSGSGHLYFLWLSINRFDGNGIEHTADGFLVVGRSWIGLDSSGTGDAGNGGHGIRLTNGTLAMSDISVVSGNGGDGVNIQSTADLGDIDRSYIGTNFDGTAAVPNDGDGIRSAKPVTLSNADFLQVNIISGNLGAGVRLSGLGVTNADLRNNYIGTNPAGSSTMGNGLSGVIIESGATNVDIGFNGVPNTIAYNGGHGVLIDGATTTGNDVHGNSIHSNGGAGISITGGAQGGVTPPTITTLVPLSGTACASCPIEIYSDTSDEGRVFHDRIQTTPGGLWTYYGPVTGPNVTANVHPFGSSSAFSSSAPKAACPATCIDGFWRVDYVTTGTMIPDHFCSAWVNHSGTDIWGHHSCTDGLAPDFTGTVNAGSFNVAGVYPNGATYTATGTYTATTASGTWTCTAICVDSGTWSATKVADVQASIPAGGGSDTIGSGSPAATVSVPVSGNSPAVTVDVFPLTDLPVGALPVRTAYDFSPDGQTWAPTVDITVTYSAASDLPPAPYNDCNALAMYVQSETTGAWTYDGPVTCAGSTFSAQLDSFSVRGFFANVDTDGDGVDDGYDDCPLTMDGDAEVLDLIQYGAAFGFDLTWPNGDNPLLIPCEPDNDDDNDGLTDSQELSGSACGSFGPTNPLDRDSDGDNYLDGPECAANKNPNSMLVADRPTQAQCGATTDVDGDGMLAYREYCFYNTNPAMANTDGDIRPTGSPKQMNDGCEAASINKDYGVVNVIDLQQVAAASVSSYLPGNPKQVDFDYTKDGNINVIDLQQVAARSVDTNCTS